MSNIFVKLFFTLPVYIFCLTVFYFIIKWAVKNGIKEAVRDMRKASNEVTSKEIPEDELAKETEIIEKVITRNN